MGKDAGNFAVASSGGTQSAGKSSEPDAVLRKGQLPAAETVRDAKEEPGVAAHCISDQVGENGNPKKRATNCWGVKGTKS